MSSQIYVPLISFKVPILYLQNNNIENIKWKLIRPKKSIEEIFHWTSLPTFLFFIIYHLNTRFNCLFQWSLLYIIVLNFWINHLYLENLLPPRKFLYTIVVPRSLKIVYSLFCICLLNAILHFDVCTTKKKNNFLSFGFPNSIRRNTQKMKQNY